MKKAKYDVVKAIRHSKRLYRDKLENDILATDSRELWKGFNKITGYKTKSKSAPTDDVTLPDRLNEFYARFDRPFDIPPVTSESLPPPFEVTLGDLRRTLSKLNVRKASGPDGICPRL